jgi:hypothetical protein
MVKIQIRGFLARHRKASKWFFDNDSRFGWENCEKDPLGTAIPSERDRYDEFESQGLSIYKIHAISFSVKWWSH